MNECPANTSSSQDKFEAIFNGSDTPMVIFKGPEFCLEMFNEQYKEIYNTRDLVIGKPFFDIISELKESAFPGILKSVYMTGETCTIKEGHSRIYNVEKNCIEDRYFHTTFSRISFGDEGGYRILATPREVTDRVIARIEIEKNLRELELERDLRDKFVSALSHDLRTPLAIAKMCAQYLTLKNGDPKETAGMIERISTNLDRADRMIRDLLDANRIKAGVEIQISPTHCHLNNIIKFIVADLIDLYGDKFEVKFLADNVVGHWDELALHRIIENLLINAVKYGTAESKVSISLTILENMAELKIHNMGKCIPPEDLNTIFDQYNKPRATTQNGWGIGLSIAKGLVSAHKGHIAVESRDDLGTTFSVKLPPKN